MTGKIYFQYEGKEYVANVEATITNSREEWGIDTMIEVDWINFIEDSVTGEITNRDDIPSDVADHIYDLAEEIQIEEA